jgi:hypothetical protein
VNPDAPALAGEQVVVSWDGPAEVLEVRSWLAGPAGVASVSMRGVDVEVDVAEPGLVALATVTGATRDAEPVLAALLGRDRARAALRVRSAAPVVLAPDEERYATRRLGTPRAGRDPSSPLARLALCRLDLEDPALPPLARVAAHAEAAAAARLLSAGAGTGVGGDLGLDAAARADAAAAFALLDGLGEIELPDASTADELTAALRAAARWLDGEREPPRFRVRPAAADRLYDAMATEAFPAPAAAPAGGGQRLLRSAVEERARPKLAAVPTVVPEVDVDAVATGRLPAGAVARWRGPAELEVRARGAAGETALWVRADLDDGTPMAVVPVRADGDDAVARLLVPPAAAPRLRVDVTHRPDVPRRSDAAAATARALRAGVDACRAERTGDAWRARERWAESARRWAEAGDERRSRLARQYEGAGSRQPSRPTVADRLRLE